jgi:hypothetical protein
MGTANGAGHGSVRISFDACLALPRVNKLCRARLRRGVVSTLGQLHHRSIRIAGHGSAMDLGCLSGSATGPLLLQVMAPP